MTTVVSDHGRSRPEAAELLRLYEGMLRIRLFEEKVEELYTGEEIPGIAHLSIGEEAVAAGVCFALRPDDYITSTHRGHGHCLAKGAQADRMLAELLGKDAGYCRGKGGSMHIADPATGNLGANAIVGGSVAIAAGAALSAKLRRSGQVAVSFIGDGALNQGLLHESMNMASLWSLPIVYVCENNQFGEYTPMRDVTAGEIRARGEALGLASSEVDGMDVVAVHEAACDAVARARALAGPSFLICETYRFRGHGMNDRARPYRTQEDEEEWLRRDPIELLAGSLVGGEAAAHDLEAIRSRVELEIAEAVAFAREAPFPALEEVSRNVYVD